MTIHLKPELEALIQKDGERGPYSSADEFVAQAVQMLHEHEQWLADGPSLGRQRLDLSKLPVRFWTLPRYPNYMIVYNPARSPSRSVASSPGCATSRVCSNPRQMRGVDRCAATVGAWQQDSEYKIWQLQLRGLNTLIRKGLAHSGASFPGPPDGHPGYILPATRWRSLLSKSSPCNLTVWRYACTAKAGG
jgi:hypothetical protein